ncbi:MAG: winged helix-turn-helix domain-containing protein, partial [Acidobacteriota bacterium]
MSAASGYSFGPYLLQSGPLKLLRAGALVALSDRQLAILHALVTRAGEIVPKDLLITTGWRDIVVSDNSLARMICDLRRHLDRDAPEGYIKTIARHGYTFVAAVTRLAPDDADLSALLA